MAALTNFLSGIGDGLISVVNFVIDFFKDIAYLVKLTGEFVLKVPDYLSWLPTEVLALLISTFTIVVLYKVLGREG